MDKPRPSLHISASPQEAARAKNLRDILAGSWDAAPPAHAALTVTLDALAPPPPTGAAEVYAPMQLAIQNAPTAEKFAQLFAAEQEVVARARLIVMPDQMGCDMIRLIYGVPAGRLRFVPDSMLGDVLGEALTPAMPGAAEPVVLAFNHYPIDGRKAGGAVRILGVLRALAQPAVLVTLRRPSGVSVLAPGIVQLAVPPTAAQSAEFDDTRRFTGLGLEDVLTAAHAPRNPALLAVANALAARAVCALFCHCYLASLLPTLRATTPNLPVIYDSHNVEGRLKAELLAGHPALGAIVQYVETIEEQLTRAATLVCCCTEADAAFYTPLAAEVLLLPHGMDTPLAQNTAETTPADRPHVGFLGSAYPPNVEAVAFILNHLAPRFPEVVFDIIGEASSGAQAQPNTALHGIISEAKKTALMSSWRLGLNPLSQGGGANVKLADYMAHGVPCLCTPLGARGYDVALNGIGMVADLPHLADVMRELLDEPARMARMAYAAARLAQRRRWVDVAAPLRDKILAFAPPGNAPAAAASPGHNWIDKAHDMLDATSTTALRRLQQDILPENCERLLIVPAAPRARAWAERLARKCGLPTLLCHAEMALFIPPSGSARLITVPLPLLLLALRQRCAGFIIVPGGAEPVMCQELAVTLGLRIIPRRRLNRQTPPHPRPLHPHSPHPQPSHPAP